MEYPTPRLAQLCFRLALQASELQKHVDTLNKKLGVDKDVLVLTPSFENIQDRKKEKERHKKLWKVQLKDIIDSSVDGYEELY